MHLVVGPSSSRASLIIEVAVSAGLFRVPDRWRLNTLYIGSEATAVRSSRCQRLVRGLAADKVDDATAPHRHYRTKAN